MKVTYCLSPLVNLKQFTMASRVLTSNLLRNEKLDVSFNYGLLESNKIYGQKSIDMKSDVATVNKGLSFSYSTWKDWLHCFMSGKEYAKRFSDSIKTDIVLMSCLYGNVDYPFVVELLNSGKKVVLGGSNFRSITEDTLREYLLELGTKEKYINNFIIVHGFVDLETDLYKVIKNWKTTTIDNNNFSTIWKCNRDYLSKVIRISSNVLNFTPYTDSLKENFVQSVFLMNNHCWWKRCKFCTYWKIAKMDFDKNISPEDIAHHIIRVNKHIGTNQVYLANDYFTFNRKNKAILDILKENNQKITIFSGILLLGNDKYLDNLNKYIDYIKIGVESGTDFALDYIDKGYRKDKVYNAFEKMAVKLKKDLHISYNIIVDLPQRNKQEVVENYEVALEWKRMLSDFPYVQTTGLSFAIFNDLNDVCIDNKFVRKSLPEESNGGRVYVFETLKKIYDVNRTLYTNMTPFKRYDENGDELRSDFEIVPHNILKELFDNWGWK